MSDVLLRDGFEIVQGVVKVEQQSELRDALGINDRAGRRGLLSEAAVWRLAHAPEITSLMTSRLGPLARPVRAIFFDKTQGVNWLVPWHQDLTIAVKQHHEVPGYGPWTMKDGIPHVQPPVGVLEQMLTLRLHLDSCDAANGALQVIPGSHCEGRLSAASIQELRKGSRLHIVSAQAGDVLLMKPLILHASSPSSSPRRRRVLHIEYAALGLPEPLEWHDAA